MTSIQPTHFHQKVEGRVFATPSSPQGGNPLTIFILDGLAPDEFVHSTLAQTCPWESVMIQNINHEFHVPEIYFYLPSGQSITYCAHAAMGACAYIARFKCIDQGIIQYRCGNDMVNNSIQSAFVDSNIVTLYSENNLQEKNVDAVVVEGLLNLVGLNKFTLGDHTTFPTMINSSVSRSKTLVMVPSVQVLHSATNPTDAHLFRDLCDSIQSTGLYLYTRANELPETQAYESRQFPRSSGYPEDPATGIAAMALACSLSKRGWGTNYEFFQGTAMGRRSRIMIHENKTGLIECSGLVLFDSIEESK